MYELPKELNLIIKDFVIDYKKNHKLKMRKIILDINLYYIIIYHNSVFPKFKDYNDYMTNSPYIKRWRYFYKTRNYEHQNLIENYNYFRESDETGYCLLHFETIYELFQIYKHKKVLHVVR